MGDVRDKREVWVFLFMIVAVNSLFIGGIAAEILPKRLYNLGRFLLLGVTLASVVYAYRRTDGLRELMRSMNVWRVSPMWYLLALVWGPSIALLVLAVKSLLTGADAFSLNTELISRPSTMRTVFIGSFIGEIVWVSYSINKLSARFGVLVGSLIVGMFWALWWLPIVILGVGVVPELPVLALMFNALGVAVMCGFIYSRTGSGPVVLLLQIMLNSSALVLPIVPTNGGIPTYWAFALTYLSASLLLFLFFGPRPLFRQLALRPL